jgi:hypothetical protein
MDFQSVDPKLLGYYGVLQREVSRAHDGLPTASLFELLSQVHREEIVSPGEGSRNNDLHADQGQTRSFDVYQ